MGHFVLAVDPSKLGLAIGLSLIAIGSGGIKPCVSAHVGDQFSKKNSFFNNYFIFFRFKLQINNADDTPTTGYIGAMGGGRGSYIVVIKNYEKPSLFFFFFNYYNFFICNILRCQKLFQF